MRPLSVVLDPPGPAPGIPHVGKVEEAGRPTAAQHQRNQGCAKPNSRPRYHFQEPRPSAVTGDRRVLNSCASLDEAGEAHGCTNFTRPYGRLDLGATAPCPAQLPLLGMLLRGIGARAGAVGAVRMTPTLGAVRAARKWVRRALVRAMTAGNDIQPVCCQESLDWRAPTRRAAAGFLPAHPRAPPGATLGFNT